ncbi:MAG: protein kinase [Alphaproteobacteria bacterium]|nr:protein kinase [Alphaproteobacteria bacterium]
MTSRNARTLPEGSRVGPYRLLEAVGSGGLATVYRAVDDEGRYVALKLMHVVDEEQRRRTEREYMALRRMNHPNVVRVFGAGHHEGSPWLALEYVDGASLEDVLDRWRDRPPPDRWRRAAQIIRDIASALHHVHGQGVFHRDIKPSNILITRQGQAKLTDFGAVKAPDAFDTRLTMAGRLVGTVAFMAPEQITGEEVDARTDLYALGAVLYLCLTGRRPVEADSIAGYLSKHLMDQPMPPVELDPATPVQLSRLTMRLLRKDRGERPADAQEVVTILDELGAPRRLGLVGRTAELEVMEDTLIALRKAEGSVIAVIGPVGSGRSALLAELAERAREDHVAVMVPRPEEDLAEATRPLLLGSRPALLLLDNADRIEASAIRALAGSLRRRPANLPLAIVYTAEGRADMPTQTQSDLLPLQQIPSASPHNALVPMGPLSDDGVVALLRAFGLKRAPALALGRRVYAVAGGLPADVVAQVRALIREGWLVQGKDGTLRLQGKADAVRDEPLPLPEARRAAILQQISALSTEQRGLLDALAVLADDADASLLDAVIPGSARALSGRGLGRLLNVRSEGFYEVAGFRHAEVRKVVYDGISVRRRRSLHLRAAEVLLARHRRRQAAVAERVAGHFLAAGKPAEAFPLMVRAAQHAARRRETRKARVLAEKALVLHERVGGELPPVVAQNLLQQALAVAGEALLATNNPAGARDALRAGLEALRAHPDVDPGEERVMRGLQQEVQAMLGMALGDLGAAEEALLHLGEALSAMDPGDRLRFATLRATADALLLLGQVDEARGTWLRSLEGAKRLGSLGQQGAAMLGLAQLDLALGQLEEARRGLRKAEEVLRSARAVRPLTIALIDRALLALLDGQTRAALTAAGEAVQLCKERQQTDLYPQALLFQAEALLLLKNREVARGTATEALSYMEGREELKAVELAQLYFLATKLLEPKALDALPPFPPPPESPRHDRARHQLFAAEIEARNGDRRRALEAIQQARAASEGAEWAGLEARLRKLEQRI